MANKKVTDAITDEIEKLYNSNMANAEIAGYLELGERTVQNVIAKLAKAGKIKRKTRKNEQKRQRIKERIIAGDKVTHIMADESTNLKTIRQVQNELFDVPPAPDLGISDEEFWEQMKERSKEYIEKFREENKITINITDNKYIGIFPFADSHFGHEGVDYEQAERDAKIIHNSEFLRMVLGGDITDNFILSNIPEAIINATTSPKQQVKLVRHFLDMANPKNILCGISGNHDLRTKKVSGLDFNCNLMKQFNIRYSPYQFQMNIKFPSGVEYKGSILHRFRFNSQLNLTHTAKRYLELMQPDNDFVIICHNHEFATEAINRQGRRRILVRPGSYKISDPYAREWGFEHARADIPVLIFNPFERRIDHKNDILGASQYLDYLNKD